MGHGADQERGAVRRQHRVGIERDDIADLAERLDVADDGGKAPPSLRPGETG